MSDVSGRCTTCGHLARGHQIRPRSARIPDGVDYPCASCRQSGRVCARYEGLWRDAAAMPALRAQAAALVAETEKVERRLVARLERTRRVLRRQREALREMDGVS